MLSRLRSGLASRINRPNVFDEDKPGLKQLVKEKMKIKSFTETATELF
jgi:hypothetical protein